MPYLVDWGMCRVPQLEEYYATWPMLLKANLASKDLWDTIESTEHPGAGQSEQLADFLRKDKKTRADITLGVKPHHLLTVGEERPTRGAWEAPGVVFHSETNASKVELTRELAMLRTEDGDSLMVYLRLAKTLTAELAGARHPVAEDTEFMHVLLKCSCASSLSCMCRAWPTTFFLFVLLPSRAAQSLLSTTDPRCAGANALWLQST